MIVEFLRTTSSCWLRLAFFFFNKIKKRFLEREKTKRDDAKNYPEENEAAAREEEKGGQHAFSNVDGGVNHSTGKGSDSTSKRRRSVGSSSGTPNSSSKKEGSSEIRDKDPQADERKKSRVSSSSRYTEPYFPAERERDTAKDDQRGGGGSGRLYISSESSNESSSERRGSGRQVLTKSGGLSSSFSLPPRGQEEFRVRSDRGGRSSPDAGGEKHDYDGGYFDQEDVEFDGMEEISIGTE